MSELTLFRYFSSPLSPFRNYRDECLATPKRYAEYAAHVRGMRMEGYDEAYFTKRFEREAFFRRKAAKRFGANIPEFPVYMTLGTENTRFMCGKRHKYAIELRIPEPEAWPLLFCIGDSMCGNIGSAEERSFFYDDFLALTLAQFLNLLPEKDCDRYVEVQLWGDPIALGLFPSPESPGYLAFLSREMLRAVFGWDAAAPGPTLNDLKGVIAEARLYEPFIEMVHNADLSFIPPGWIHGAPHSFRCSFLALAMAIEEGLPPKTALWTAKCAAYHDSGRLLGSDDIHGELALPVAEALFFDEGVRVSHRIMRCHCENSEYIRTQFDDTEQEYLSMAEIVHDADSLDYLRFSSERGLHVFDRTQLARASSARYISAALEFVLFSLTGDDWMKRILL